MSKENVEIARAWAAIWNGVDQVEVIGRGKSVPAVQEFNDRYQHQEFEFEIFGEGWLMGPESGMGFRGWAEWVLGWASLRHEYGEPVDCGDVVLLPTRQYVRTKDSDVEMEERAAAVLSFRQGKLAKFEAYGREEDARRAMGLVE